MFLKFGLLFFVFISSVNGYDQILQCSDKTPLFNLSLNSFTLLQSPSFPKTFGSDSLPSNCHANFTTDSPTTRIWILMLNGFLNEIQFHDLHNTSNQVTTRNYISNFDVVNFTTSSNNLLINAFSLNSQPQWAAYQAVLITYPQNFQGCPLEGKEFDFSIDANSVIPITPTFLLPDIELSYKICNWGFTISKNQQLKVVVRKFSLAANITLNLNNETRTVHSFTDWDLDQAFYFDGTKFTLTYEFNYANVSNTGFLMLVSAVPKFHSFTTEGCQTPSVDSTTTNYTNMDYVKGYPAYQQCKSAIAIPSNHEATLSISDYNFEGISDKLILNYGKNSSNLITWEPWKNPYYYKLTSDVTGGQLVFTSDGNTQGGGYRAILQTYECKCSDSIFVMHCDFSTYLRPMNGIFPYCSNMECEYKIIANSSCPNSYFSVGMERYGLRDSIDYLVITDDGSTALNITSYSRNTDAYFSPKNNVTVQFHSGPSSTPVTIEDKSWLLEIAPMTAPRFTKIKLTQTNSKYVKWLSEMRKNEALTVCTSIGTLEIFIPYLIFNYDLRDFYLYDAADLDNFVGSLNSIANASTMNIMYPISRKSSSGCFTLYFPDDFPYVTYSILFKISDDSQKNCQNSNSVFQIPTSIFSNFDVTVKSTTMGSCEMIILTLNSDSDNTGLTHIWISNITVSDMAGQYSVYSTENNKELLSFKGSDASKFQSFGVYTPALSIIAPPSSSISILLTGVFQSLEYITVSPNGQQKGIMASPSYSGFMQTFNSQALYKSRSDNHFSTTFNVKEINGDAKPMLQNNGKNQTLIQGSYTTKDDFILFYEEKDPKNNGFLIEYTIVLGDVPPTDSTTPSPTVETATELFSPATTSSPTKLSSTKPSISSSTESSTISLTKSSTIISSTFAVSLTSSNPSTVSDATKISITSTNSPTVSKTITSTKTSTPITTSNSANLPVFEITVILSSTLFFVILFS